MNLAHFQVNLRFVLIIFSNSSAQLHFELIQLPNSTIELTIFLLSN